VLNSPPQIENLKGNSVLIALWDNFQHLDIARIISVFPW